MNKETDKAALAGAPGSEEPYAYQWNITIKADSLEGTLDAMWAMWEAWREGSEPLGGFCPKCMGNRMTYEVKKIVAPNAEVSEGGTRDSRIETAAQARPSLH